MAPLGTRPNGVVGHMAIGGDSGVTLPQVCTKGRGAMKDALMATTASGAADVLVTGDGTLRKKVCQSTAPCEVWTLEQLQDFIRAASEAPSP
jgi:hypothetical protein